jgi:hypothetical protein
MSLVQYLVSLELGDWISGAMNAKLLMMIQLLTRMTISIFPRWLYLFASAVQGVL